MSLTLSASGDKLRVKFYTLRTPRDVAELLEIDYSRLVYHIFKVPPSERYTTFEIPKKSGGVRKISTPVTALKIIQRKLNMVLQYVYEPKPSVHSFIPEKSIATNARVHSKKRYILNIDLKDFFPSINFGRVRGMFMAIPYNLDPKVATVLAQICCFNNELPQGAPTSPIISNMICKKMDSQLQRLAKKYRCTYTRYADDITFSTSMRAFPSALARINSSGQVVVGSELYQIIKQNGFEINSDKVRLRTKNRRQEVTGLTANERPNVRRRYVRRLRAMLHAWEKFGLGAAEKEFLNRYDRKHRSPWKKPPSFKQVVKGKIDFLGMIVGKDNEIYLRFRDQFRRLVQFEHLRETYKSLKKSKDPRRRGYMLETLLKQTFELHGITVAESFRRNRGSEQIDGAFKLNAWYYIVECRWRKKLSDIGELDGLRGKVSRSSKQTMGFFLSINGWSANVPELLKQNPDKSIILMDGEDLDSVLDGTINLREFIEAKVQQFNFKGVPFYGAAQYLKDQCIT